MGDVDNRVSASPSCFFQRFLVFQIGTVTLLQLSFVLRPVLVEVWVFAVGPLSQVLLVNLVAASKLHEHAFTVGVQRVDTSVVVLVMVVGEVQHVLRLD